MAMSENGKKVFNYLKENYGKDLTAHEIAEGVGGITVAVVTGSVNALVKKGFAVRTEVEVAGEEGKKPTIVKYISLTPEGTGFDPDAEVKAEKK